MTRALITGCSTGIGRATAIELKKRGLEVVATARRPETLNDLDVDERLALDVTDDASVANALVAAGEIDVLVNNAGIGVGGPVESVPLDEVRRLMETNFFGVVRMMQAFIPQMRARGRGTIVNVSSVEGVRGYPPDPVYAACKAAVVHFTRSLGVEVAGKGVKVNGIAPDLTESAQVDYSREPDEMWPTWAPVGRKGKPVDQARVLLFLASDLSDFLVGHTIPTDGGSLAAGGWFPSTRRKGRSWTNRPHDP